MHVSFGSIEQTVATPYTKWGCSVIPITSLISSTSIPVKRTEKNPVFLIKTQPSLSAYSPFQLRILFVMNSEYFKAASCFPNGEGRERNAHSAQGQGEVASLAPCPGPFPLVGCQSCWNRGWWNLPPFLSEIYPPRASSAPGSTYFSQVLWNIFSKNHSLVPTRLLLRGTLCLALESHGRPMSFTLDPSMYSARSLGAFLPLWVIWSLHVNH